MSSVVIAGNTSGTVTLSAPAVSGTTTLTLPATSGTLLQSGTAVTVAQGGTGLTTLTSGGAVYATSTSALTTGTLPVASGGTGRTTNVAYSVICGGTTAGGVEQSVVSVGTSGQVLTSGGAGVLPTFTTISSTPTTAQVQTAIAGSAAGDLGTYTVAMRSTTGWVVNTDYSGSVLVPTGWSSANQSANQTCQTGGGGSAPSGTWKAMMTSNGGGNVMWTLFLRVA